MHDFRLLECCPAGGVDFEKPDFLYFIDVLQVTKELYLVGFEHREYVRTPSFEKMLQNALVNVSNGPLELEL